ncbi:DUF3047 domain-containing protein [Nitrosospira sp. NRS527]|uniref:DUF3047 domain-containing protein n=1 Tax=Nitrosospira sp. NRS527 TaxID=155925 RepID=UPI001FD38760|nr:DUF3047 domain-containing protein [Nitrosospira sp. NRS527]
MPRCTGKSILLMQGDTAIIHRRVTPIFEKASRYTQMAMLAWVLAFLPALSSAGNERVDIARFSRGDLASWKPKMFSGSTHYAFMNENGRTALRAQSNATASGLYREVSIELGKTPILNWTWKTGNILAGVDERTRAGDDYPARVYVVFSGGMMLWRTRAINYVWSSRRPVGSGWPNAFTGNAYMIAVESGSERAGRWVEERRDVLSDYRQAFGEEPGPVDAVAIMTDTDNTGTTATAWYGDIWFSSK